MEKQDNNFRFVLSLKNDKITEELFSADLYNPVVRYSVNIREMIPTIISSLQKALSMKSNDLTFVDKFGYNSLKYYKHLCEINELDYFKLRIPQQQVKINPLTGKPYSQKGGTEFKFGLYINQNTIVERNFYVDGYNPESRFSSELILTVNKIVDSLEEYLRKTDVSHMWDDNLIISVYDFKIQQVRDLSKEKREEMINKSSNYAFIDSVRAQYHSSPEYDIK